MDPVLLERRGGVATLTLNRPDNANSLNLPLATRLRDLARDVAAELVRDFGGNADGSIDQAVDARIKGAVL